MNNTTFNESLPFAALTVGQARDLINTLIADGLERMTPKEIARPQYDMMNVSDTAQFLQEHGYFIKRGSIYNLTATKSIPFRKIGRRVVFSRAELTDWVQQKVEQDNSKSDAALTLSDSAKRKR